MPNYRPILFTQFLQRGLPVSFSRRLSDQLDAAYRLAYTAGRVQSGLEDTHALLRFLEQQRLADAQGIYAQDYLHRFATTFPDMEVEVGANTRKHEHVQIKTRCVLLTVHRVRKPGDLPPSANYRDQNAAANWCWLPGISQENTSNGDFVYLYLLHGPSIEDKTQLGFVQLGVPNPAGNGYIAIHSLYKHSDYSIITPEVIKDEATISLRTDFLKKLRAE